jgi:hypothetical protein
MVVVNNKRKKKEKKLANLRLQAFINICENPKNVIFIYKIFV